MAHRPGDHELESWDAHHDLQAAHDQHDYHDEHGSDHGDRDDRDDRDGHDATHETASLTARGRRPNVTVDTRDAVSIPVGDDGSGRPPASARRSLSLSPRLQMLASAVPRRLMPQSTSRDGLASSGGSSSTTVIDARAAAAAATPVAPTPVSPTLGGKAAASPPPPPEEDFLDDSESGDAMWPTPADKACGCCTTWTSVHKSVLLWTLWLLAVLVTGGVCYAVAPELTIANAPVFTWAVLVVAATLTLLGTRVFVTVLLLLLEAPLLLTRNLLYFVLAVQTPLVFLLWSLELLALWLTFPRWCVLGHCNRGVDLSGAWFLLTIVECMIVGSIVWLLKNIALKVVATHFHQAAYFDRLHDALFEEYALQQLINVLDLTNMHLRIKPGSGTNSGGGATGSLYRGLFGGGHRTTTAGPGGSTAHGLASPSFTPATSTAPTPIPIPIVEAIAAAAPDPLVSVIDNTDPLAGGQRPSIFAALTGGSVSGTLASGGGPTAAPLPVPPEDLLVHRLQRREDREQPAQPMVRPVLDLFSPPASPPTSRPPSPPAAEPPTASHAGTPLNMHPLGLGGDGLRARASASRPLGGLAQSEPILAPAGVPSAAPSASAIPPHLATGPAPSMPRRASAAAVRSAVGAPSMRSSLMRMQRAVDFMLTHKLRLVSSGSTKTTVTEIESSRQARALGAALFRALQARFHGRTVFYENDFHVLFPRTRYRAPRSAAALDEHAGPTSGPPLSAAHTELVAVQIFRLFDRNGDGTITRADMRDAVTAIYSERKSLALSLRDNNTIMDSLNRVVSAVLLIILVFVWLALFRVDTLALLVTGALPTGTWAQGVAHDPSG